MNELKQQLETVLDDLHAAMPLDEHKLLVIGASTSEVIGKHIGSSGTEEVGESLFAAIKQYQQKTNVQLAFQCCEHLNRALVVERATAEARQYDIVSVIPVKQAGGSMATYAYQQLKDPVVVEFIRADAGIDIGDTFIGMHLKHVAVPVRSRITDIGQAHVTLAKTRPKMIGGARAVYERKQDHENCT
ncbi:TIGR01440 family protein [Desertibacillus haloalkaliphilus]|uniref:TIGR01440 family protein n=1 Tax=Desertibacillus haloalkaliphilus TaxID=1328930 RepID=UPI001C27ADE0|nr:TIGR01440 family protein [Desertibacillus haloalkaliphilus]MBU8905877.1 TIGR01440 family protein [Desertibacillus haloalkaliphilus]